MDEAIKIQLSYSQSQRADEVSGHECTVEYCDQDKQHVSGLLRLPAHCENWTSLSSGRRGVQVSYLAGKLLINTQS